MYCCTPKALYNHVCGGVFPQPPPVCSIHLDDATAATVQQRQCAHHTPATGGEDPSDFIKNILFCVPTMNEGLTGLERHEGDRGITVKN